MKINYYQRKAKKINININSITNSLLLITYYLSAN